MHTYTPLHPHSFTPSLPHSFTPSLLHLLTLSPLQSLTPSLLHLLTPSLSPSFTPLLLHSFTPSLLTPCPDCEIAVSGGDINVANLHALSPPGDLIHAFGLSIGCVANEMGKIHQFVTWLRNRSIRLNTPQIMEQVKTVLRNSSNLPTDTIDRYARNLRSLLSCETLPEKFNIT